MDWKRTLEIAGVIVGLVGAGAAGSWALYSDELQSKKEQIADLEKINKFNYPEFLENVNSATTSLQAHINTLEDIKNLKNKNTELNEVNKELLQNNENLTAKISELNKSHKTARENDRKSSEEKTRNYERDVAALKKEIETFKANTTSFELLAGNGLTLKQGKVQVGFTEGDINFMCKFTVNNKKYDLEAGSAVDVTVNERACKVVLTKCSRESYSPSSFELVCS